MNRPWIWLLIAAPTALIITFFALMLSDANRQDIRPAAVRVSGEALIGGPFELVDHTGRTVTDEDFLGRPILVYFGYSYCPDICPFDLQMMAVALDILEPDMRDRFQPVFITIDPARDTVDTLAEYVTSPAFADGLIGLTGSEDQVRIAKEAYRVFGERAPANGEESLEADYLMSHTAFTYLMGAEGEFIEVFSNGSDPAVIAARLREYAEHTPERE